MNDRPRLTTGAGALAGGIAGAVVGFADGLRAALLTGTGAGVALQTALLAASVDAVLGVAAGATAELVARAALWGRGARPPRWARVVALVLAGLAAAGAAAGTVMTTALRNNRFLAAGLTALAALAAALGGVVLWPVVARLLAPRRSRPEPLPAPGPAAILLAPLAAALLCAWILFPLAATRPLAGPELHSRMVMAAVVAALLPAALVAAAKVRLPVEWRAAVVLAVLLYGSAVAVALAMTWGDNLRFAPWADILVGAGVALVGALVAWAARDRLPDSPVRVSLVAVGFWLVAIALVLGVSPLEPPRKVAGARAAVVGATLDAGRRLLDFDGDGYARALGGGDCDDGDPLVHPGALDLPGDGSDADCDGEDATEALPPPAQMVDLPPEVPRDLDLLLVTIDTL